MIKVALKLRGTAAGFRQFDRTTIRVKSGLDATTITILAVGKSL